MHRILQFAATLALAAVSTLAGGMDGKWVGERSIERDGQSFQIIQTFDLKSEGTKLTGTLLLRFGDRELPPAELKDGTVDGGKFAFTIVLNTPNGEFVTKYSGTVEGAKMKGSIARNGGDPVDFEATRQ